MPTAPGICFVAGLAKNGATAKLWSSSRFASPPLKDTALPSGSPTASTTTGTDHGGDGAYRFSAVTPGLWYVSLEYNGSIFYDTHDIKNPLAAPTVIDYGAVGDGLHDDTTAVQAALNDTAQGLIVFPQGTYLCGNLTISNRSNFTLLGQGGILLWTGTAGAGDQIGLRLSGVNSNVTIRGLEFLGDGVAANGHCGVWWKNGDSPATIRIEDCWVRSCARGVSGIRTSSGTWNDLAVTGCFFDTIVGATASSGHGIYLSNNSSVGGGVRITNNEFSQVDQVSVYLVRGVGYVVSGNRFRNHGLSVGTLPAIQVERCSLVTITGNQFYATSGGSLFVIPTGGVNVTDVLIAGNSFDSPTTAVADLVLGTTAPAADGVPEGIVVTGNSHYRSGKSAPLVQLRCGLRVRFTGNEYSHLAVATTQAIISLEGQGASTTYNDDHEFAGNTLYGTISGGGVVNGFSMDANYRSTGIHAGFRANRVDCTNSFAMNGGGTITVNTYEIVGQATDGLSFNAANRAAASGYGRMSLVGGQAAQSTFISDLGRHGFAQTSPTSIGHFGGALAWPLPSSAKTADYVFLETDGTIKVDTTAANRAVTLPDPATCPGRIMVVKRVSAGANSLTVAGAAGNVDGAASVGISSNNECWGFQSDGVGWWSIFTK
jgi:hypothetical protein